MQINPVLVKFSRQLRKDQTPWEKKLWMHLRSRRFFGIKFKRQQVLGSYIYDFGSFEKKIVIKLDGSGHSKDDVKINDEDKQSYAESLGYRVLRFNNNDFDANLEGVLEAIRLAIT
jgi:very-short-patch-repair endonuclease